MTIKQVKQTCTIYISHLASQGYNSKKNGTKQEHILWMLEQIMRWETEVGLFNKEKMFRWLGFIQGYLWSANIFTIEEMKDHNR